MTSRWLQALDFIKGYYAQWGHSPTLGELGAELGVTPKRAYDIVHILARKGSVEVEAGKRRGIRLADRSEELSETDVLARLSALGWTIGHGDKIVQAPIALAYPLTRKGLPRLDFMADTLAAEPPHNPGAQVGSGTRTSGKIDQSRQGARPAANARGAAGAKPRRLGQAAP